MGRAEVLYDPQRDPGLATFQGPGGFTQVVLDELRARGVATALGIPFVMCEPGTTIPEKAEARQ